MAAGQLAAERTVRALPQLRVGAGEIDQIGVVRAGDLDIVLV